MSTGPTDPNQPIEPDDPQAQAIAARLIDLPIEDELKDSYLTYAMSVIVSRALPDVRDGLKPSQRRILVAMNDLNLTPGAGRVKCAKISGDTSGNYHPHGESVIYPTLVRMAQEWNMRHVLIDKQGNFGSIAGLPPAAMRYTEARMSPIAATDARRPEARHGRLHADLRRAAHRADGAAVEVPEPAGQRRQRHRGRHGHVDPAAQPGRGLRRPRSRVIDDPDVSIDELLEIIPGPDFPTGGIICGRAGIRRGYHTGRSTIVVRSQDRRSKKRKGDRYRIVVTEIPYQQTRDPVIKKIADVVNEDRITGISGVRNESDLERAGAARPRPEARRRSRRRAEPALPVLAAAGHVLAHLPGAGRRQAADAVAQGDAGGVHPPSRAP